MYFNFYFYSSRQDDDSYQNFVPFVGVSTFSCTTVQTFVVVVRFFKAIYLKYKFYNFYNDFTVTIDQFNAYKK